MKTISVSVDDETHRLVQVRAAETGTTVSAMMRDMLLEMLKRSAASTPAETEPERNAQLIEKVLKRHKRKDRAMDNIQLRTPSMKLHNRANTIPLGPPVTKLQDRIPTNPLGKPATKLQD